MNIKYVFAIIFPILFLSMCQDPNLKRVPDTPVFLRLSLTGQYPTFRDNINDTLVFTKPRIGYEREDQLGYGGILIVVGIGEKGTDYFAYDLCCPFEVQANIRVYPDGNGHAKCRVCGSTFYLTDGWGRVTKGPSKWSLKRYQAEFINSLSQDYVIVTH